MIRQDNKAKPIDYTNYTWNAPPEAEPDPEPVPAAGPGRSFGGLATPIIAVPAAVAALGVLYWLPELVRYIGRFF